MAKYNIGGYIFNDENSARKAAKELKAVEHILGQLKTADEQEVLKIYREEHSVYKAMEVYNSSYSKI